ncbi:type II secretion system secretin GspD [Pseudomarimonas salicorniae]|uniref:Type II secretion system secretin GspD n=1 Tax=Pseudomarimonas salicorniae TaxID=2933270 RepID=A0ABT0GFV0_9GAMM|nr:type II secretion system secretin GspD [Lysobacter sp. CAU 1642]MCK7593418.1 type II secretion system secretin GspD [Lysobacter sp. CAU 1642]
MRLKPLCLACLLGAASTLSAQEPPVVHLPQAGDATPRGVASQEGRHTLNLKGADIGVLIQTVSEITGKSFIVDPRVEGKVTVISSKPMDAAELYETFQSVLRVHGFAAVPAGGQMVKILPDAMAVQDGGTAARASSGKDELVTRLITVKHVPAQQLVELLRPLMPQQGHFQAHGSSNSLLITDRAGNVDRLSALIARIDTASDAEVEIIPLRHASAAEVARTLSSFDAPGGAAAAQLNNNTFKLVADDRTNSVLLSGDKSQRLRYRALIAHLDTPLSSGENTQVMYLRYAKASDIVPILEGVADTLTGTAAKTEGAKPATIQVHEDTNALVVTASPAVYRELAAVVRQLDVRRAQVLVEAIIAEVSDDLADELGVQWQTTNYDGGANESGVIGGTNFPNSQGGNSIVGALTNPLGAVGGGGLNLGYLGGRVTLPIGPNGEDVTVFQVGALVRALRGDGRANILSNPSVVTLDHQEAEFKVVQEVPFLTGQYTNTTQGGVSQPANPFQTVDRRDVGLILTVTPHVNEGDAVRLDLKQEVSSLAPNVSGAVDLITNKRELTTSVMVADGGLLVLGGLKQEETLENTQGVPGLSRIPLLGHLFKSRSSSKSKRNLMVFLRPTILRDAAAEQAISSEKYNFLRSEQIRLRENHELRYRNQQPVLPALPVAPSTDVVND